MENTILSADFDFFSPKKPTTKPPNEGNGPLGPSRMAENLKGSYNKQSKVSQLVSGTEPLTYTLTFKIKMETKMGESMSVVGSLNELGRWKDFRVAKMKWTEGHIW